MEHTKEEIQKKFEALPNDVREAISSVDTSNIIVDIGEKYELNHEQIDKLIYESGLVMLAITHSDDFLNKIRKELELSRDQAEKIVKDLNEKIFLKIRFSLRKIYEENQKKPEGNEFSDDEDEFLDREKVLNEIENPLGDHGHVEKEKSIVENKLEGVIKMPMAEKEIKEEGGIDPYREAV